MLQYNDRNGKRLVGGRRDAVEEMVWGDEEEKRKNRNKRRQRKGRRELVNEEGGVKDSEGA
jgi:hypothetical protein